MTDFYDELEFPSRAEYIDQYDNYKVDISHWRALAQQFQKTFRGVFARHDAAVLLVHGPQGSGKSMFCQRLAEDYEKSRKGAVTPEIDANLWHVLVATDEPNAQAIEGVTAETAVTLVDTSGEDWLGKLKAFATNDRSRVRVFLCDDAQLDGWNRPWTDLSAKDFYELRKSNPDAILANVAERINLACRREFKRSIFVLMSNDRGWIDLLHAHLEKWYRELVTVLTLPAPEQTGKHCQPDSVSLVFG